MTNLRQLAKEEAVKNVIDKIIFGLIAALIVFGVQECSNKNSREQIEKEAILKLESEFILNEAKTLQIVFSEYISLITEALTLGLPLNDDEKKDLLSLRVKIESSLEVLSVHNANIKTDSKAFVQSIVTMNEKTGGFDITKIPEYQTELKDLKIKYGNLLNLIKSSAIDSLADKLD